MDADDIPFAATTGSPRIWQGYMANMSTRAIHQMVVKVTASDNNGGGGALLQGVDDGRITVLIVIGIEPVCRKNDGQKTVVTTDLSTKTTER